MTRQFNQQPRDDSRPPSRRTPSRYAEQQSARPARPRLNRAMVDRGWENGSPRHHADYHPRMSSGQAPQSNWRKNQEAGDSSYNGPVGNRTNGNHQAQQRIAPSSQAPSAPRKQPFESKGYNAENRRFSNQHQENEPYGYNNQRQPQGRGSDYHSQRRSNEYSNHRSQPNREYSNGYGNNDRLQRNPEWDKGKEHGSFNGRSRYSDQEQGQPHPRLQSRPETYAGKTKKAEVVQPPSREPRPFQRGYKWPKP